MRALTLSPAALLLFAVTIMHIDTGHAKPLDAVAVSTISDAALSNTTGHIGINTTAGTGNLQANVVAISISALHAEANVVSEQSTVRGDKATSSRNSSGIESNAFRSASGIISVNQSSGNANAQANLVAVAIGKVAEVSIDQLRRVNASQSTSDAAPPRDAGTNTAIIADSAFFNARGIVQVNQLAGSGNTTANLFTLNVSVASP